MTLGGLWLKAKNDGNRDLARAIVANGRTPAVYFGTTHTHRLGWLTNYSTGRRVYTISRSHTLRRLLFANDGDLTELTRIKKGGGIIVPI